MQGCTDAVLQGYRGAEGGRGIRTAGRGSRVCRDAGKQGVQGCGKAGVQDAECGAAGAQGYMSTWVQGARGGGGGCTDAGVQG